jgi:molybdopterin molybdotransferase
VESRVVREPPLPLEEAQARLLALAAPLPIERVDIEGAIGRYLAEPLLARRTHPPTDLSAMDGYAVAAGDMTGPWQVIGESAAGHPFQGEVTPGKAVRISTGAAMPASASAVILQEDLNREGDMIVLTGEAPSPPGKHVRRCGLDFRLGGAILSAGTHIGPAQAALAVSAGHSHLAVRRRPRVAVLDSGDELAVDLDCCAPHQIPASNGVMLAAMARALSSEVDRLGPVPDDMDAMAAALERTHEADVIVTSGGASVGDHDLVRPALAAWGAELDFWRVAIKPGKPILVATRARGQQRQLVIGLPGNPVSSHVTAYFFLLPVLRRLLGAADPMPRRFRATLSSPLKPGGSRREFLRGRWDGETVSAQAIQDSGALAPLAASNVLIDLPAGTPAAATGDTVFAYLLENGGLA